MRAALLACAALVAAAAVESAEVYVFWQRGCAHCERALGYTMRLESAEPDIDVLYYEIRARRNARLYRAAVEALGVERLGVPMTVVGSSAIVGYLDDASTGAQIRALAAECRRTGCTSPLAAFAAELGAAEDSALAAAELGFAPAVPDAAEPPEPFRVPLIGEVDLRDLSLPVLTLTLAAVDGFNPCALWVLVFLIGLLLGHPDPLRRWWLGGVFLATTALVYYVVIAAWLNAVLLLGAVAWLRIAIGLTALGGGAYYAYRYFRADRTCRVVGAKRRQRILAGLRAAALEPRFAAAAAAIAALAIGVNFVELLCSAGIPAVYTQILAMTPMPAWQYHAWLGAYVLVFVADDAAIFVTAMLTLQLAGVDRYAHRAQLIGAIVLLTVGALLLARPEWLTFS